MGKFFSKKAASWGIGPWRVFWDVLPYHSVSKDFPTKNMARGFKQYLWRAFKIRSFIRPMDLKARKW